MGLVKDIVTTTTSKYISSFLMKLLI